MTQLQMRAVARCTDPDTSHAAAASLGDLRVSQSAVLDLFVDAAKAGIQSLTDDQLVRWYERQGREPRQSPSGLRTRRRELTDAGFIEDTGDRTRLASGRQAVLWKLA